MNETLIELVNEVADSKKLGVKDFVPVLASCVMVIATIIGYFVTKRIARKLREFERDKIELTRRQADQKDRELAFTERQKQLDILIKAATDPRQRDAAFAQIAEHFPMYASVFISKTRDIKIEFFNRSGFLGQLAVPSSTNHPALYFSNLPGTIDSNSMVSFTFKVAIDYPKDQPANGAFVYTFGPSGTEAAVSGAGSSSTCADSIPGTKILFGVSSQPGNENLCCVQVSEERLEDFMERVRRKITAIESDDDIDLGVGTLEWSHAKDRDWAIAHEQTTEDCRFRVKTRTQTEPSSSCEFKVKRLTVPPSVLAPDHAAIIVVPGSFASATDEVPSARGRRSSIAATEFPLPPSAEGTPGQADDAAGPLSVEIAMPEETTGSAAATIDTVGSFITTS